MMRRILIALFGLATGMAVGVQSAQAAEITDVLDAADELVLDDQQVTDPFDIALNAAFVQRLEYAKLKRELNDVAQRKEIRLINELVYERVVNTIDLDLEIGLYKDLSLHAKLPVILSDVQSYKLDRTDPNNIIDKNNSWFSPGSLSTSRPYKFFDIEERETVKGDKRSGVGDMTVGLAWSPYNHERHYIPEMGWREDTGRSTYTIRADYTIPISKARAIDNNGVGKGVHELQFAVAASHRYKFVDPYISFTYGLPLPTSFWTDYGETQQIKSPGMWGRFELGIEFVPYESLKVDYQRYFKIDLRGHVQYNAAGRVASELMDVFKKGQCQQNGVHSTDGCGYLKERPSNAGKEYVEQVINGTYTGKYAENGLYVHEGFVSMGGTLRLAIQPIQYVEIFGGLKADYMQNHFITWDKAGIDKDGDKVVDLNNASERNPAYSTVLDMAGQRIKRTESLTLEWFAGLSLAY